jgi:hypothetical protein
MTANIYLKHFVFKIGVVVHFYNHGGLQALRRES